MAVDILKSYLETNDVAEHQETLGNIDSNWNYCKSGQALIFAEFLMVNMKQFVEKLRVHTTTEPSV